MKCVVTQLHQALRGLLEECLIARQCQKLLGVQGAAEWPQAGAAAPGHDDGKNGMHGLT